MGKKLFLLLSSLCLAFFLCIGCKGGEPNSQTLLPNASATIEAPGHQDFIKAR